VKLTLTDIYIIGKWTVESALNQLSKLDNNTVMQKVIIVPKVMTLLQCLAEHDGHQPQTENLSSALKHHIY